MKLLVITRKVDRNDSRIGAVYDWVKKLSERVEELRVIVWQKSDGSGLPVNVKIIELGDRHKFIKAVKLERAVWRNIRDVDGVFCHMNPEYAILAAPIAKLFGKKIVSWYVHKQVSWRLKIMNWLTDIILTASEESCRLKNRKKIKVVGHGINTEYFKPLKNIQQKNKFIILTAGRISPIKNHETLIRAIEILKEKNKISDLEVQIVGEPGLESQQDYLEKLRQMTENKELGDEIKFLGPVSYSRILPYYQNCDLFVNLSGTGSLDKAVLEAMACRKLVLASNEAFIGILGRINNNLTVAERDPKALAEKINWARNLPESEKEAIGEKLRREVTENHSLDNLADKILGVYQILG